MDVLQKMFENETGYKIIADAFATLPLSGGLPAIAISFKREGALLCVIAPGDSPKHAFQNCAKRANGDYCVFEQLSSETIADCLARNLRPDRMP